MERIVDETLKKVLTTVTRSFPVVEKNVFSLNSFTPKMQKYYWLFSLIRSTFLWNYRLDFLGQCLTRQFSICIRALSTKIGLLFLKWESWLAENAKNGRQYWVFVVSKLAFLQNYQLIFCISTSIECFNCTRKKT